MDEEEDYREHEFYNPGYQFECMKLSLGNNIHRGSLLEWAEEFDITPKLLEAEEAAFLVPYYNLLTEIKRLIGIDDKDQFASFLIVNRELVQKYSPFKVFQLICQHSAVACATALLESGLNVDINLKFDTGKSPLFMAARNLSYGMTKVLLDHGADPDLSFSGFGTPLRNAVDAFRIRASFPNLPVSWFLYLTFRRFTLGFAFSMSQLMKNPSPRFSTFSAYQNW